ncbi:MAG: indole-3-glycerol phosphate synthase TrpC [Candidatus Omnitrophica bacterium]|nr:indole-3-glycerol phosphate synthase TrpC [Candidatus Omnitrophota bacterium]
MILTKIVEEKKKEVEIAKEKLSLEKMQKQLMVLPSSRGFKQAITKSHEVSLIAEIKKASPSSGLLRRDFEPVKIAQVYRAYGARALSVLTDEKFFQGKLSYIDIIRKEVYLPILRKDFIIDKYQIYESKLAGADAVLFIAGLLSRSEMFQFLEICKNLAMDAVVEIHNEEDLHKALSVDSHIIGINNRNLHTFEVDLEVTSNLVNSIPEDKTVISESGIQTYENIMFLKSLGIDAVLIGETFMRSDDIGTKVRELMGY